MAFILTEGLLKLIEVPEVTHRSPMQDDEDIIRLLYDNTETMYDSLLSHMSQFPPIRWLYKIVPRRCTMNS